MKRDALELAASGIAVFPLAARGKVPMIPKSAGGRGCLDATTDAEQIASWWYRWPNANVGILTTGLLVVDLDGEAGLNAWSRLEQQHGTNPTRAAATGSGGLHLYYRSRVGRNSAGKLAPKVDTRGLNGYVVAPPSIHPNGTAYAWVNDLKTARAPTWIEDALTKPDTPAPFVQAGGIVAELGNAYATHAWAEITRRIATAGEGTRNDQLNAGAYSAGRLVASNLLSRTDAEHELLAAALACGLRDLEARTTIKSGLDAGTQIPVELKEQIRTPSSRPATTIQPPRFRTPRIYPPRVA